MKRLALIVLVAACGSKPSPPAKAEHEDHHEEKMAPELAKFHDVLAPRWHAPKGPERMTSTCSAIPEFQSGADALAKTPPPGSDVAATKEVVDAVAGLKSACDASDAAAFETAFARVHKGFHGLLEGGEHHM
jgi:hypothetical protein